MDVGHQWDSHTATVELGPDRGQILGLAQRGRGDSRDLTTRVGELFDLIRGTRGIQRVRRRHGLDADRLGSAEPNLTDGDLTRPAPSRSVGTFDEGGGHDD